MLSVRLEKTLFPKKRAWKGVAQGPAAYLTLIALCCYRWVTKSRLTLCDPRDCSPPGSFVHGTSEARILEWVAISFFRGSSWPRDRTRISCIGRWIFYYWASREAPDCHKSSQTVPIGYPWQAGNEVVEKEREQEGTSEGKRAEGHGTRRRHWRRRWDGPV